VFLPPSSAAIQKSGRHSPRQSHPETKPPVVCRKYLSALQRQSSSYPEYQEGSPRNPPAAAPVKRSAPSVESRCERMLKSCWRMSPPNVRLCSSLAFPKLPYGNGAARLIGRNARRVRTSTMPPANDSVGGAPAAAELGLPGWPPSDPKPRRQHSPPMIWRKNGVASVFLKLDIQRSRNRGAGRSVQLIAVVMPRLRVLSRKPENIQMPLRVDYREVLRTA